MIVGAVGWGGGVPFGAGGPLGDEGVICGLHPTVGRHGEGDGIVGRVNCKAELQVRVVDAVFVRGPCTLAYVSGMASAVAGRPWLWYRCGGGAGCSLRGDTLQFMGR